jgi:GntR family transcriptional repressor for pyruvate dehydrogenase complex
MPKQPIGLSAVRSKIKPIKKVSISEDITRQLVALIMSGHLESGQRLPSERDLCIQFGASRTALREALRCRIALESAAAANMAANATPEQLARLQSLLDRMETAQSNTKRFAALDLDFHMAIAEASTNPMLTRLITLIREHFVRGVARVLLLPDAIPLSLSEHKPIARAIEQRNPQAAAAAMESHLSAALLRYKKAADVDVADEARILP